MKRILLSCLLALVCAVPACFAGTLIDGIYYNFNTLQPILQVTYFSYQSEDNGQAYKGDLVIPEKVTYNGTEYTVTSIGEFAFAYCHELTSLTLPETINEVNRYAFWYCDHLKSVNIPDAVQYLGPSAFWGCSILEEVNIPYGIAVLQAHLFRSCLALKKADIPETVTEIQSYAFYDCESLDSLIIPDNVVDLGGYTFCSCRSAKKVRVSNGFTGMLTANFQGCTSLEDVDFGTGVTVIGGYVLDSCYSIKEVTIPDNVVTIETYAMHLCTSLEKLTIGNGTEEIGNQVCESCTKLTELSLGSSVKEIGEGAFRHSPLEKVTSLNPTPPTIDASDAFGSKTSDCVLYVPEGAKSAYQSANVWKTFANIEEIPDDRSVVCEIDGIWYRMVSYDDQVCEVTWGGESSTSGTSEYTGKLEISTGNIHFPEYGDRNFVVMGIGKNAFDNCKDLEEVEINLTSSQPGYDCYIDKYAFRNSGVTSVTLGRTATIGEYAFAGSALQSIDITDQVTSLGDYAFEDCSSLSTVTIGSGLTSIGDYTFSGTGLTSLTIPSTITSVGSYAFQNTEKLGAVSLNCQTLGDYAFYESSVKELSLGERLRTIGDYAFASCANIESLTMPGSVSIGRSSFQYCTGLKGLILGEGMTTTGSYAFQQCTSLSDVTLPSTFTTIEQYTFAYDSALEEISLPANLTRVGVASFRDTGLKTIYSYNSTPPTIGSSSTFDGVDKEECVVYVPKGSTRSYFLAAYWDDFFNIEEMDDTQAGIDAITIDSEDIVGIYSLGGQKLSTTQPGVNIVRFSDGTTKKMFVK